MRSTTSHRCLALTTLAIAMAEAAAAEGPGAAALAAAGEVYALHLQLVWVCAAIALGVYAAMVYGLVTARGRAAAAHSARAELLWAIVPAVILIGLAAPAIDRLAERAAEPPARAAIVTSASGSR